VIGALGYDARHTSKSEANCWLKRLEADPGLKTQDSSDNTGSFGLPAASDASYSIGSQ